MNNQMYIQDYMLAYIEKHLIKEFKENISFKFRSEPSYIITPHGTEEELKYIEDFLLCFNHVCWSKHEHIIFKANYIELKIDNDFRNKYTSNDIDRIYKEYKIKLKLNEIEKDFV